MNTFATTATVEDPGQVRVAGVPFAAGTEVAVSISPKRPSGAGAAENAALDEAANLAKRPAYDELAEVANSCASPDWEAHGSEAVKPQTVGHAHRLIEALPSGYPLPSLGAEPDGHITLEWYRATDRLLSVSVSPDGILYWAALLGDEDPRGSCHFDGEVPDTILYWIDRVCTP